MEKETNFFDLCVICGRGIGRALKAFIRMVGQMCRLTVRLWWIVVPVLALAIGLGLYMTRPTKITYKVNAVAFLNGVSVNQFEQSFAPLRSARMLDPNAAITPYVTERRATKFATFRVIDAKADGIADYIDFRGKSSPTDTVCVQMDDRLCIQFRVEGDDVEAVPQIEQAILEWLNSNDAMQTSFAAYQTNMKNKVAFNHRLETYLDSLAKRYCMESSLQRSAFKYENRAQVLSSESKIDLTFRKEIEKQQLHVQLDDVRYQFATAPVTLENHFVVESEPLNGRGKMLPQFILLGWIIGCAIAEIVYKRKAICAWMKK